MGLYLAEWLRVMREGASQIQLLPCSIVSSYTSPHAAGLVAEGEGRMLLAPAAWGVPLAACDLARSRAAYLAGEDFLAIWDSARQHEAYLISEREESA